MFQYINNGVYWSKRKNVYLPKDRKCAPAVHPRKPAGNPKFRYAILSDIYILNTDNCVYVEKKYKICN